MLNLDMNIVGDPAYIPTSDAYWQDKVRKGETYTTPFMPDGTINYNLTPPFIRMNLRTPVDYDATTISIAGKVADGNGKVKFQYGTSDKSAGLTQTQIGYDHKLFKNFKIMERP